MKTSAYFFLVLLFCLPILIGCSRPKEPQYLDVQNLRILKAGLSESVIGAELKYYNPNNFRLQLKEADLDVYINDKFVGHSSLDTLLQIPARDTFYVPLSLKLKLTDLFRNAAQLFLNPEIRLKLLGKARVGKGAIFMNIPINYEGIQRVDLILKDSALLNHLHN